MEGKFLDAEGKPLHRMQPQTGGIPPIQISFLPNGQVLLKMFCRTGPSKGKWHFCEMSFHEFHTEMQILHTMAVQGRALDYLQMLEAIFEWKWDGTELPEGRSAAFKDLTLDDLLG